MKKSIEELLVEEKITSFRRARRFLQTHDVSVNGMRTFSENTKIDIDSDEIKIDGKKLEITRHTYIMLNKKSGTICSHANDNLYHTVYEGLPYDNLHSIGRLDVDTEGLLILTDDGKTSQKIANPKFHKKKTYFVRLLKKLEEKERDQYAEVFSKGFFVPREKSEPSFTARPSFLEWISDDECNLTITEGKFHQVKRMFDVQGNKVTYLKRIKIGHLELDESLEPGQYKILEPKEMDKILMQELQ